MNLIPIRANMTELQLADGTRVLFSYKTPVAMENPLGQFYKTDCRWSNTTTRHINQWLAGSIAELRPQSSLDNLISEVK